MEPNTGKRIVSKGAYAKVQAAGGGLAITAVLMSTFGLLTLFGSIGLLYVHLEPIALVCLYFSLALCWCARNSFHQIALWKDANKGVVPLTRANTANLLAPDSLVRASSEPIQEQQAVLLRAATAKDTPLEQLVRPAGGAE